MNNEFKIHLNINNVKTLKILQYGFAVKSRHNVNRRVVGDLDECLVWLKKLYLAFHDYNHSS